MTENKNKWLNYVTSLLVKSKDFDPRTCKVTPGGLLNVKYDFDKLIEDLEKEDLKKLRNKIMFKLSHDYKGNKNGKEI